jgi:hypothetical protein
MRLVKHTGILEKPTFYLPEGNFSTDSLRWSPGKSVG